MKKNILVWACGNKNWMGGIYYVRNLLFQLSLLDNVEENYKIYICINEEMRSEYIGLEQSLKLYYINYNGEREQLLEICDKYHVDIVFPMQGGGYEWIISDRCLYWIPDFQEVRLPENFSVNELVYRAYSRRYIAQNHKSLMLSSMDAWNDYKSLYPEHVQNVFVVHFLSYIEKNLASIDDKFSKEILEKYGITYDYVYVANQFWKHKNHKVVLEAMDRLVNDNQADIHLICTGFMQSYGSDRDEYVEELCDYVKEHKLENKVHFLGLLEREEQLCLMKNANLLIQPSKFEGWGCSVEDAKVMGKTMLLSDIEVHKEQSNGNSFLFPQDDSGALADLILKYFDKVKKYDMEAGRQHTYTKGLVYAKEFERAISVFDSSRQRNYMHQLEEYRERKIQELFAGLPIQQIGIYGGGKHTEQMLKSCKKYLKNLPFVYFDSDENKWGKEYLNGVIHSPEQISQLGIKKIIISSRFYQEEIQEAVERYGYNIEIVKVYNSEKEKMELLWG